MSDLTKTEAKAVMIAVDELRTYIDAVGNEDDRIGILKWAERKLNAMLAESGFPEWVSLP